jgi:hypothetical protein
VNARKPVHLAAYEHLPRPGVVVGDQLMTDGLLARRLNYAFLHYRPPERAPAGPMLLDLAGRLARPLIFPSWLACHLVADRIRHHGRRRRRS